MCATREIADTLLSLFSKWPGIHGERVGNYQSCVKGLVDLLFTSGDIARVDAILFLLEYMIELFDIDSSDSSSDVSDEDEFVVSQSSEGIQLLQSVLRNAHALPTHPVIINGIARCGGAPQEVRSLFHYKLLAARSDHAL